MDRHVLPIAADVKFRLQHNALGFRYKFWWRTDVITTSTCIHTCNVDETAIHMFWHCPVAHFQWEYYLVPFRAWVDGDISWSHILFLSSLPLLPSALPLFGNRALLIVFNIVRCCVLRSLWLHRNKLLYNPGATTNARFVRHHCYAYVDLHLRKLKHYALDTGWCGLLRFITVVLESYSTPTPTTT